MSSETIKWPMVTKQTETENYTHAYLPNCIDFCIHMTFE